MDAAVVSPAEARGREDGRRSRRDKSMGDKDREDDVAGKRTDVPRKSWDRLALKWIGRWAPLIISLLAFIVSGVAAYLNNEGEKEKILRAKREELRAISMALVDLRAKRLQSSLDTNERYANLDKRAMLLEAAETIVQDIPKEVPAYEYLLLGDERKKESNYTKAERFYMMAVEASRDDVVRIVALRSLASFYFEAPGPHRNVGTGRAHFQTATAVYGEPTDQYRTFQKAMTYAEWAKLELTDKDGSQESGIEKLDAAKRYWSRLPESSGNRVILEEYDR